MLGPLIKEIAKSEFENSVIPNLSTLSNCCCVFAGTYLEGKLQKNCVNWIYWFALFAVVKRRSVISLGGYTRTNRK
jgi:hypothetical protein